MIPFLLVVKYMYVQVRTGPSNEPTSVTTFDYSHSFVQADYPIRSWGKLSSASDWIVCAYGRMWIN